MKRNACLQVLLLAAAALWGLPAWCAPLRVAVAHGTVSLPLYVAEAVGAFKQQGLDVETVACNSGRDCLQMLAQGKADVATAAEFAVVLNAVGVQDPVILATLCASSDQLKLVARRSAGISRPSDLKSKRIGTVVNSSAEYFLDSLLVFHDVRSDSISVVAEKPDRLPAALVEGKVNAIAIWEPHASTAVKLLGHDHVVLPVGRVYTQYFNLVTDRRTSAGRHEELRKLLAAVSHANSVIAGQPGLARKILATRLAVEQEVAQQHIALHDFRLRLDQSLMNTMSNQARWIARAKPGTTQAPVSPDVIDSRFLRSVSPMAVTLVQHHGK